MGGHSALVREFWERYRGTLPPAERDRHFFEAFSFGGTAEGADLLAELVLQGVKTATSELLWSREAIGEPLWKVGDEHVVLDGKGQPVCVIRTTELRILPFDQVDGSFVRDYGEGERSLEWWRRDIWDHYETECRRLGRIATPDMPLICERFEVVYRVPERA
jgi:uncharacterized protein YhfF